MYQRTIACSPSKKLLAVGLAASRLGSRILIAIQNQDLTTKSWFSASLHDGTTPAIRFLVLAWELDLCNVWQEFGWFFAPDCSANSYQWTMKSDQLCTGGFCCSCFLQQLWKILKGRHSENCCANPMESLQTNNVFSAAKAACSQSSFVVLDLPTKWCIL